MENYFSISIDDIPLSRRARAILKTSNIASVGDIINWQQKNKEFVKLKNCSRDISEEISNIIKPYLYLLPNDEKTIIAETIGAFANSSETIVGRELTEDEIEYAKSFMLIDLELSVRAFNCLKYLNVKTALDITSIRTSEFIKVPNVGIKTIEEIKFLMKELFVELPNKDLNISLSSPKKDVGRYETIIGRALTEQEVKIAKSTTLEELDMSVRALNGLKKYGTKNALDVALTNPSKLIRFKNVGKKTIVDANNAIEKILKASSTDDLWKNPEPIGIKLIVNHLLDAVSVKQKSVISDRYGLWDGIEETLGDIGDKMGVTRERIRQIESKGIKKIVRIFPKHKVETYLIGIRNVFLSSYFKSCCGFATKNELTENAFSFGEQKEPKIAFDFIRSIYELPVETFVQGLQFGDGNIVFADSSAKNAFEEGSSFINNLLISKGKPLLVEEIEDIAQQKGKKGIDIKFVNRVGEVSSIIGIDESNRVGLQRWNYFNAKKIHDMAQMALIDIGRPAHFSEITERMNHLFPKKAPFSVHSVHGRIIAKSQIFVYVKQGTYALANWGVKRVPYIKDYLVESLNGKGGKAMINDLVREGMAKYGFRESSIRMNLTMKPRVFKAYSDGSCKLM